MRVTEEQYRDLVARLSIPPWPAVLAQKQTALAMKRQKYGNVKVTDASGAVHDSTKEYRRWCELQLRERAGEISDLRRHPRYDFCVNGVCVGRYTADASYVENGKVVVEDAKSKATRKIRDWPLRRNLMQACHGIQVREV